MIKPVINLGPKIDIPASASGQTAEQVAKEFETIFFDLVLKGMRATVKPEVASNALNIYEGLLDSEYAKTVTGSGNFGIKDLILDWMKGVDPLLLTNDSVKQQLSKIKGLEDYRRNAP